MTKLTDANVLYDAGFKAMKPSYYKYGTQLYEMNHLLETARLQKAFLEGSYEPQPGVKFEIKERGHERYITSAETADKAVSHIICDEYLTPLLGRYLQYDNSASQKGKGVAFHRHRFKVHLRQYYEREGTNEGFILFSDFSGYYANILHEVALSRLEKYLAKEMPDPVELAQVLDVLRKTFKSYELDVSRLSDSEIEQMYREKISSTFNVGVPSSVLTGEKMLRKGVDIGNQISQNVGIFLPAPLDNYVKIVCGIKGYARYSDDFYAIARTKEELHEVMDGVRREAAALGLIINEQKTCICMQGGPSRHLQMLYSLKPDGEITCKINPKSITRERRKLKAYKRLLDAGRMEYAEIENNFKSWICTYYRFMSMLQIQNMIALYKELFGKDITWKKSRGHGRLRWLMAQPLKT